MAQATLRHGQEPTPARPADLPFISVMVPVRNEERFIGQTLDRILAWDYLRALVGAFERSGAACVGRPQPLDVAGATAFQRAVAAARASRLGHNPASFIYADAEGFVKPQSVAVAYRRSVFAEVGLFD